LYTLIHTSTHTHTHTHSLSHTHSNVQTRIFVLLMCARLVFRLFPSIQISAFSLCVPLLPEIKPRTKNISSSLTRFIKLYHFGFIKASFEPSTSSTLGKRDRFYQAFYPNKNVCTIYQQVTFYKQMPINISISISSDVILCAWQESLITIIFVYQSSLVD